MPVSRQQIIIRVFRKYSHSLGPDELEYLDEILKEHDITDEDVEMSIERIAKEYNKQDGSSLAVSSRSSGVHAHFFSGKDATMKVSVEILNRVYQTLQSSGDQRTRKEDGYLDPEDHLHFVDAFEMPLWHWSPERGSFEK
jgi:DNA polymerase epsilon subunit 2